MTPPSSEAMLAGITLVILGSLGAAMLVLPIPLPNAGPLNFVLGAISGALTLKGISKVSTPPDAPAAAKDA